MLNGGSDEPTDFYVDPIYVLKNHVQIYINIACEPISN